MLKKKTGSLRSKSYKIYKKIYQKTIECEILKQILKDFEPKGDQISRKMLIFAAERLRVCSRSAIQARLMALA